MSSKNIVALNALDHAKTTLAGTIEILYALNESPSEIEHSPLPVIISVLESIEDDFNTIDKASI